MDTRKINLFVFDTKANFQNSLDLLSGFKDVICIEKIDDLAKYFDSQILSEDEYLYMVIHVFAFDRLKGIKKFLTSGIPEKYPGLGYMYITDAEVNETDIQHEMLNYKMPNAGIYYYHQVYSCLQQDKFKVLTKKEILQHADNKSHASASTGNNSTAKSEEYPNCDYAIITALEEDEMEQILPMIVNDGEIKDRNHLISYGHFHTKPEKRIVYASQQTTGMVDAAILATQLIVNFRPKFLIMPGVLGGNPNGVNIGDIIVSTKVFTIDKGKFTSEEILGDQTIKEQINIVENEEGQIFKKEIESVTTNSSYITKFIRKKDEILQYIKKEDRTRKKPINLLFGPIACVRQVIDQKGYFEENILVVDRKTIGLEMESYGIARACEVVNNGETIAIIAKSVMDNTIEKTDDAKTFAAFTSAKFVEYILENDLI